jgi:sugar phosphate isomerase/epimerase
MYSRRDFGKLALAGVPFSLAMAAKVNSVVNGVRLGSTTYCFRDFPRVPGQDDVEATIKALQEVGAGEIELYGPTMEPAGMPLPPEPPRAYGAPPRPPSERAADQAELLKSNRDALRRWRLQTSPAHYRGVREKFEAGGISLFACTVNYDSQFTDDEINATFEQAKAMGVETIASSMTLSMAKRVAPFADQHRFPVALHGHSQISNSDAFHTPESFAAGMALSQYYRVNLDIGHFTAANQDPVAYIRTHHATITHLHIKDRRRNDGVNEQFGDGDTPIPEVLALLRELKSPVRALVEYEYAGLRNSIEETRRSMEYMRRALA